MVNLRKVNPLNWNTRITDEQGRPTPLFQRLWQSLFLNDDEITTVQQAVDTLNAATITAGTGLTGGGTLLSSPTIALADTAVTPGSYTTADITVDQQGRITAAANGAGGGGQPWWFAPPLAADFPTTILGTGTTLTLADDADIGLTLDGGVYVTLNRTRAAFKALPAATSFTVDCRLTMQLRPINRSAAGLILRNSSTGRLLMLRADYTSPNVGYTGLRSTNENTFSGDVLGIGPGYGESPVFFRFVYDHAGATYNGYYSRDGKQWVLVFTETTAFIGAADQIGLGFQSNVADTARRMLMSCDHWAQSF